MHLITLWKQSNCGFITNVQCSWKCPLFLLSSLNSPGTERQITFITVGFVQRTILVPDRCLSDILIVHLAVWLSTIMKHADQTPVFSQKPIRPERVPARTTSSLHVFAVIECRLPWKCYLFLFTGKFQTFYFVSVCWAVSALALWYFAFPLSSRKICLLVCNVPLGENHLQTSSDLRSQCVLYTMTALGCKKKKKTRGGNELVNDLRFYAKSGLKWSRDLFCNICCNTWRGQTFLFRI